MGIVFSVRAPGLLVLVSLLFVLVEAFLSPKPRSYRPSFRRYEGNWWDNMMIPTSGRKSPGTTEDGRPSTDMDFEKDPTYRKMSHGERAKELKRRARELLSEAKAMEVALLEQKNGRKTSIALPSSSSKISAVLPPSPYMAPPTSGSL